MNTFSRSLRIVAAGLTLGILLPALEVQANPPKGVHVPGELRLAGLSRIEVGQPIKVDVWAIRPEMPYHYSGVKKTVPPKAGLQLELRDAKGKWVGGAEPRFRHGKWQPMTLAADGLRPGRYEVVLTLFYDDLPFNQARKRITVLTAEEWAATVGLSSKQIAAQGSLETRVLEGDREVAVLPKDRELVLPLPGDGDQAVYGTVAGPSASFLSALAGRDVQVPGFGSEFLDRELFLGVGKGGADTLVLQAGDSDLQLVGLRFEPISGVEAKLATHDRPMKRDRDVVLNNDGFSETFFDPDWNYLDLPRQVLRYKKTDATQLDWCALATEVVNYPSAVVDFFGENHVGKWSREGEKAAFENYQALDKHEPKMFPWLVATGQKIGLPVWGSLRMGAGYGSHPFGKILNGQMWFDRPEMRIKRSPDEKKPEGLLSLGYREVQDRRIGVLTELAEMGCEGVNLDYCRYPTVMGYDAPLLERFQKQHGEDGNSYALDDPKWVVVRQIGHNEFLRRVRAALNKAGKARGKRVPVSIRLPATKFESFGFDPQTWIKEGLVDVLIPGFPGFDRWFDIAPWVAMAKGSKVKIWANMEYYRWETSRGELTDEEVARGMKPGYQFKNQRPDYLRRSAEVYAQGADGIYVFNRWVQPELFYGLSDAAFVASWQEFRNPDNRDSVLKP